MKKAAKSKKRNLDRAVLWAAIYLFLISGFLLFYTFFDPPWAYETLLPKTVTVAEFDSVPNWSRGRHYELTTMEGARFRVGGAYHNAPLREAVTPGVTVEIKYSRSKIFRFRYVIEELCVHGKMIVSYRDHRRASLIGGTCVGVAGILAGVGVLAFYCFSRHLDRIKAEKRRARIEKKYGRHGSDSE